MIKRCPTCNKTFTDQTLSFCIDDGTPLIPVSLEDNSSNLSDDRAEWKAAYQPPGSYVPPGGNSKRRVWSWVLGIVGVLVIGVVGLSIAAALWLPGLLRNSAGQNHEASNTRPDDIKPNVNGNPSTNQNSNPAHDNSNDAAINSNDNSSNNENIIAPTDQEMVLVQLTDLEHEWTVANLNADKKKLGEILADDYVGPTAEGGFQGKAEYIRNIQRDTTVENWEFQDLKLTLRGDRATLKGQLRLRIQGRDSVYDFVDKFVWRDGRWQATGSEVTPQ